MTRLVLVHGAYGGAWCWERVIPGLEALGHTVEAIDLPGAGEDRTPVEEITLAAYADRICEQLARSDEPAVLAGHSMGGVAITQAAYRCPERIARLLFVCAFMPRDGQSLLDLTRLPEGEDDLIQANIRITGDPPIAHLTDEATREAIYNCCTPEQAAWGVSRRRPQPVVPFATPVEVDDAALAGLPRAYVLCLHDQSIPPALQRRMVAEHGVTDVVEIDTDHAPFLSAGDELVAALDRLAG